MMGRGKEPSASVFTTSASAPAVPVANASVKLRGGVPVPACVYVYAYMYTQTHHTHACRCMYKRQRQVTERVPAAPPHARVMSALLASTYTYIHIHPSIHPSIQYTHTHTHTHTQNRHCRAGPLPCREAQSPARRCSPGRGGCRAWSRRGTRGPPRQTRGCRPQTAARCGAPGWVVAAAAPAVLPPTAPVQARRQWPPRRPPGPSGCHPKRQ